MLENRYGQESPPLGNRAIALTVRLLVYTGLFTVFVVSYSRLGVFGTECHLGRILILGGPLLLILLFDINSELIRRKFMKWKAPILLQLKSWLGPAFGILWFVALIGLFPIYRERSRLMAIEELNRLGASIEPLPEDRYQVSFIELRGRLTEVGAALRQLGGVLILDFSSVRMYSLVGLENGANIQALNLRKTQVTDLTPIASATNLELLDLGGTKIDELSPLRDLHRLRILNIQDTKVHDLTPLGNLENLQQLFLPGRIGVTFYEIVSPQGSQLVDLEPLRRLLNLQVLVLQDSEIGELDPLRELENLQALDLQNTSVSDLEPLQRLTNLQVLILRGTQVSDITPIYNLHSLNQIDLRDARVSGDAIISLRAARPKLTILWP